MTPLRKLSEYRKALAEYYRAKQPPIHKPTRIEFGIKTTAENFVAERIEREIQKEK